MVGHPQTNWATERFNRTLIQQMRKDFTDARINGPFEDRLVRIVAD